MGNLQPYRFWTKEELYSHCERQCRKYGAENLIIELKKIIFDSRWNPIEDYNGCNVIQDKHHPYPPCLIHDYQWMVEGGGYDTDVNFRSNLKAFGTPKVKSVLMFIGVRCGWIFYYKWKKR